MGDQMQQVSGRSAPVEHANWLVVPRRQPAALRLVCFPSAGHGPAMFRPWLPLLPPDIELVIAHLPGRESRWSEPALTRIADVVTALEQAIRTHVKPPYVFYGHSLGALIAYEVARRLDSSEAARPQHLFASAHRAPQRPNRHPRLSELSDAAFLGEVNRRHGGIPESVAANRELMDLMLPSLRADYRVFEDYAHGVAMPISSPVTALFGSADTHVTREDVEPWRDVTTGAFELREFAGGHFFVNDLRTDVVATVLQTLQRAV